ncbi:hypothetical protein, partial [Streptosporangium sp. NPDC048865]|uniref:hypothetical protein n=1 Tax=Streptosporangium sp. NPDC048865 TaxID=3155766 RepID=UPI003442B85D
GSGGVLDMLRGLSASSGGGGGDYSDAASDLSDAAEDLSGAGVIDRMPTSSGGGPFSGYGSWGSVVNVKPTKAEAAAVQVHVHPQPGQSEFEIGTIAARKVGSFIR